MRIEDGMKLRLQLSGLLAQLCKKKLQSQWKATVRWGGGILHNVYMPGLGRNSLPWTAGWSHRNPCLSAVNMAVYDMSEQTMNSCSCALQLHTFWRLHSIRTYMDVHLATSMPDNP